MVWSLVTHFMAGHLAKMAVNKIKKASFGTRDACIHPTQADGNAFRARAGFFGSSFGLHWFTSQYSERLARADGERGQCPATKIELPCHLSVGNG
jgi:hypothetical protein